MFFLLLLLWFVSIGIAEQKAAHHRLRVRTKTSVVRRRREYSERNFVRPGRGGVGANRK